MKITKRQLRKIVNEAKSSLLSEMNPDGTISPDEDEARDDLLTQVEIQMQELIQTINDEADRIGGPFRSPGIRMAAFRLMREVIEQGIRYKRQ
tara:strand:+ start:634 stop:912 length:279 start_codon:yes stop_codon:yes gene_type:complete